MTLIAVTIGAAKRIANTALKGTKLLLMLLATTVLITVLLAGCADMGWETTTTDRAGQTQPIPTKPEPGDALTVHYIDVGQADSILLEFPSGQTMLIDGGNKSDGAVVVDYINRQGIKRIDHVIGTHPHQDHIGGLGTVLNNITVDRMYMPKVVHNTNTYRDLLLTIKKKGLKVTTAKAGLELEVGPGAKAVLLAPGSENYEQLNNHSVVLKVTHGNTGFLLTGDAEALAETEMLEAGYDLKADVLKVAHHGSNSSTTKEFLKAVAPRHAVITCGENNDYGHPHAKVLARLESAEVQVFRTDLVGTVIATSNGKTITFNKQSSPVQERAPDANTGEPRRTL